MINYEFTIISPQQLKVQLRYTKDGFPDYWINTQTNDFSDENLQTVAQNGGERARAFWDAIAVLPAEVTPSSTTGVAKPRVTVEEPVYDSLTHKTSFDWVESDDAFTQTWTVTEKTDAEKAEALTRWRETTTVSMRQARLALLEQGLLSVIDDSIALIPEPDKSKVSTEWEYASIVERNSTWVAVLQPALGLTDEQMDDLFKLAGTL